MKRFAATIALALCITPALAADEKFTGNTWLPHCKNVLINNRGDDASQQSECVGVVMALRYAMVFVTDHYGVHQACVPSSATNGQIIRVVVKYLEDHPKKLNSHFMHLMMEAIADAWPCTEERP
jgi:hypothetical protein